MSKLTKAGAAAEGIVITVQPGSNGGDPAIHPRQAARWLDILAAGVNGTEVEILVGKREHPDIERGTSIVIVCGGIVRCRIAAARLVLGVYGYMVLVHGVDVVKAVPVSVARDVLMTRWEDTFGKPPPTPITFPGTKSAWWREADEQPFPGWASTGLAPEEAEVAKSLVRSWNRAAATPPPATPPLVATAPAPTPAPALEAPEAPSAPVAPPVAPLLQRSKERASSPPKSPPKTTAAPARPLPAPPVQAPPPPPPVAAPPPAAPPPTGQRSLF